jgi:hypothetical protein
MSLKFELRQLCHRNRDGSFATQNARVKNLQLFADQLKSLGYVHMSPQSLRTTHVNALVKLWKEGDISTGTIKNRMAHLRWWAEKINKQNIIPRTNDALNIDRRVYVAETSKAISVTDKLDQVSDDRLKVSLRLQEQFGLRREESLKFSPAYADRGTKIVLKPSWTKGGQGREIIIRTDEQRRVLADAHRIAGKGSLIPPEKTYAQWMKKYQREINKVGIHKAHGLRHAYAQNRYQQLTGWTSPAAGGPKYAELTSEQKKLDRLARLQISEELGHHRIAVTSVYLGR